MGERLGPSSQELGQADPWSHPEKIQFSGGEVNVFDIKPEHETAEVPVIFLQGWGGTAAMFREDIDTFAANGRRSLAIDAPRGIEHAIESPEMPDAQLRKVAAMMNTLDTKGIDKVDAVGNSEGGIVVTLAAKLYPERFRNIVLEQPAGMIGQDYLLRLATKFPLDIAKSYVEGFRKKELREPRQAAALKGSKPAPLPLKELPQAIREVSGMAKTQIHELLRDLKKQGIGISIIHGVDDVVFPVAKIQKTTRTDMIDGFYSVMGKHDQWRTREQRKAYSRLAEYALSAMEKKT